MVGRSCNLGVDFFLSIGTHLKQSARAPGQFGTAVALVEVEWCALIKFSSFF